MLDKKTFTVLSVLEKTCGYSYKVVKKQQLLDSLPERFRMDTEELISTIKFLQENQYLTVKYHDKEEICLALSVKSQSYLSGQKEPAQKATISNAQSWFLVACVFVASFLGALLALLIGKIL